MYLVVLRYFELGIVEKYFAWDDVDKTKGSVPVI